MGCDTRPFPLFPGRSRAARYDWTEFDRQARAKEIPPRKVKHVALIGPAGVGKDTVARLLADRYGYTRVAFADALKDALIFADPQVNGKRIGDLVAARGWDGAKANPEVRRLLQAFGVAMRRVDSSIWVRAVAQTVEALEGRVVLTDVRFPNEVEYAKQLGAVLVRLDRVGVDTGMGWRGHISERALDDVTPDLDIGGVWTPPEALERIVDLVGAA
jgi:hypothetical protein